MTQEDTTPGPGAPAGDPTPPRESGPGRRQDRRRSWRLVRLRSYRMAVHLFGGASMAGLAGAMLAFAASMTPSLLPRPWFLQGLASGAFVTLGYGAGAALSAVLRRIGFDPLAAPRRRRFVFRLLLAAMVVALPVFGVLGARWQYAVRLEIEVDPSDSYYYALVLLIAAALVWLVRAVLRLLRLAVRLLRVRLARWIPPRFAKLIALVTVSALLVAAVDEALLPAMATMTNASFSGTDNGTPQAARMPASPLRSGSPHSAATWDSLGFEGRGFVAAGPTVAELEAFSSRPASEPIRVYAGLKSVAEGRGDADLTHADLTDRLTAEAALVVDELHRTGAFDRAVLAVAVPTGRGWVNLAAAAALEYLWNGDTAIASMQYSYLPSIAALLADQVTPEIAGQILFEAVSDEWELLPAAERPKLISMGESLGAFGAQSAFDGIEGVLARVDGAVWAGTPQFTPLWRTAVADRDPGSPIQHPVVDDCHLVCFATRPGDIPAGTNPHIVYLQHTNDPVVWWSPELILHRPEWLARPALPGRTTAMRWIPVISFWQVTMDIIVSNSTPDGQGHHYGALYADAFAAVVPPPGWGEQDTERLRVVIGGVDTGA